jgi:hypothetical protein
MLPLESYLLYGSSIRIPFRTLGTFPVDPKTNPKGSVNKSVLKRSSLNVDTLMLLSAMTGAPWSKGLGTPLKQAKFPKTTPSL